MFHATKMYDPPSGLHHWMLLLDCWINLKMTVCTHSCSADAPQCNYAPSAAQPFCLPLPPPAACVRVKGSAASTRSPTHACMHAYAHMHMARDRLPALATATGQGLQARHGTSHAPSLLGAHIMMQRAPPCMHTMAALHWAFLQAFLGLWKPTCWAWRATPLASSEGSTFRQWK